MKESRVKKKNTKPKTSGDRTKPTKSENGFLMDNINIDINSYKYDEIEAESTINEKMGIYGYNINLMRAIPNIQDGLKDTERVIIYTGFEKGFRYNKEYRKSLKYIGAGSDYYVHGDASFYSTMVSMAKDFYTKYPMLDSHGNMGSITGEGAAAQRYTACKLSKFTEDMLVDFTTESVDWKPNYDESEVQPVVLPVAYPNILLNNAFGIGQGFIGSIPSHNFKDIIDRTILLINNPDIDEDELIGDLVPDYPTGGVIINKKDLKTIYKTGNDPDKLKKLGINQPIPIKIRGKIEENKNGNLVIRSIPYMKNTNSILDKIQEAVKSGKIEGISGIKDHTNKNNGVNIELIIKRGHDPKVVENLLYKFTPIQDSISTHFICTTPDMLNFKYYTFKEMLQEWINFRRSSLKRVFNSHISKTNRKIHIDEGLLIALDPKYIDKIIKMIRASKSADEVKENLINDYHMTEIQAEYISNLKLVQLCNMEIEKIRTDKAEQEEKLKEYISYFTDKKKLDKFIIDYLLEGVKKYNTPRITEAIDVNLDNMMEATIENTNHVIFITHDNFIKKVDASKIRTQNAKGQGINIGKIKENDYIINTLNVENLDDILFFTNLGRLIRIKVYDIKDSNLNSFGLLLDTIINLKKDEKVVYTISNNKENKFDDESFILFATKNGLIKKSSFALYKNVPKSGFSAIDLNDGDELIGVNIMNYDMDVIVSTNKGNILRYNSLSIPLTKRTTKGVKSINLNDNEVVVGFDILRNDRDNLLVVTNKGNGKLVEMSSLSASDRTKSPKILTKLASDEEVINTFFVSDKDEVTLVGSKKVIKIPVNQIPVSSRSNPCKTIIKLGKNEKLLVCNK